MNKAIKIGLDTVTELLRSAVTYTEKRREKLNREIREKLPRHRPN